MGEDLGKVAEEGILSTQEAFERVGQAVSEMGRMLAASFGPIVEAMQGYFDRLWASLEPFHRELYYEWLTQKCFIPDQVARWLSEKLPRKYIPAMDWLLEQFKEKEGGEDSSDGDGHRGDAGVS